MPKGLDWDMWVGPIPAVAYVPQRTHVTFRYWWEYSGGTMTDWGAHHNDIALGPWARRAGQGVGQVAGRDDPERVHGRWNGAVLDPKGQQHGVKFVGADGWIFVTRGKIEASDPDLLQQELPGSATRLYASNDHMGNFFECVRTRKQTVADAEVGHRSVTICHPPLWP